MLLPYVELNSSTSKGNCNKANKHTGMLVAITRGAAIHVTLPSSTSARAELNAIRVAANDMNNERSPIVNLFGNA